MCTLTLTVLCTRAVLTLCSTFQVKLPAIFSSSNHPLQVSSVSMQTSSATIIYLFIYYKIVHEVHKYIVMQYLQFLTQSIEAFWVRSVSCTLVLNCPRHFGTGPNTKKCETLRHQTHSVYPVLQL